MSGLHSTAAFLNSAAAAGLPSRIWIEDLEPDVPERRLYHSRVYVETWLAISSQVLLI